MPRFSAHSDSAVDSKSSAAAARVACSSFTINVQNQPSATRHARLRRATAPCLPQ